MSATKRIKQASLRILGCEAEPWDDVWKRVKELSKAFNEAEVVQAFEEWAEVHQGEVITRPVAEFLKTAAGQLKGTFSLRDNPELKEFIFELSYLTDNEITFDKEQQIAISRLLKTYTKNEIKSALGEFHISIQGDSFAMKMAPAKFVEKAEQFIYTQRKRIEAEKQDQKEHQAMLVRERRKVEEELAKLPVEKEIDWENFKF